MAMSDLMSTSAIDRTGRRGSILLVLLLALGLVAVGGGLVLIGGERSEPYILVLLAVLGMIGVFSLFAAAAGILRIAGDDGNHVLKSVADGATDGICVTDPKGRIVYANASYRALTKAVDADDIRPVERAFIGDPEVSALMLTVDAHEVRRVVRAAIARPARGRGVGA